MGLECSLLTQPAAPTSSPAPGVSKPPLAKQYKTRLDQLQGQMERMMQIMRQQGVNDFVLLSLPDGTPSLQPQKPLSTPPHQHQPPFPHQPPTTLTQGLQHSHDGIALPPINYRMNPSMQAAHYPGPLWTAPALTSAPTALVQALSHHQQGHIAGEQHPPWHTSGAMAPQYQMFRSINTGLFFQACPANFLQQVLNPAYLPAVYRQLITPAHGSDVEWREKNRASNVISEGVVTKPQAVGLMKHFLDNFNHWINLPAEMPVDELVDYLQAESSLLLTICCAVALRYGRSELRAAVHVPLLRHLHLEVMQSRMNLRQNVEFLQAATILSNFAESLSSPICLYDAWFASSWGIQHLTNLASVSDERSLHMHRLWNHLAIAHLYSCNSTGRRCILSSDIIRASREILKIPQSNQFDACILAEISAQFAAYRYFNGLISTDAVEDELRQWEDEWSFLTAEVHSIQFASGVHTYIRFMVRLHQLLREPRGASAPTAPAGSNMVVLAFQTATSAEICEQIERLSSVPVLLLERVTEPMFACLGDQLQQLGLLCCVLTMQLSSLVSSRPLTEAQVAVLRRASGLVDKISTRFQNVSQSPDDVHATSAAALRDFQARMAV